MAQSRLGDDVWWPAQCNIGLRAEDIETDQARDIHTGHVGRNLIHRTVARSSTITERLFQARGRSS